ncbi:cohesin domain-containing protein [Paenibacillus planticolens]|uniref:Alpha-galactosidase n=1 Tax=Paenibacillus planticolens TaxID=2654976 RepID=A0ABX1ZUK2_9BACL|nr:cohesin domain-containing protein [Paenibacillus planticolens]NOV03721.1 carbohydrate-binding protein [Paenibacillus planticolens]
MLALQTGKLHKTIAVFLLITCLLFMSNIVPPQPAHALENGLGRTPMMAWSSWNAFRVKINEQIIKEETDELVNSGMKAAGYTNINIDDGFFGGRDANGFVQPNSRFPNGMKAIADYIHSKGLKAGIYTDAGRNTCGYYWDKADDLSQPGDGSYDHRQQDFDMFIKTWGYDFIKVDWCGADKMGLNPQTEYTKIRDHILATGIPVMYEVCNWKFPGAWVTDVGNQWRVSGDIAPKFSSIMDIVDLNADLAQYAGPGHFNHMDMLQVGNGMSYEEDKTHFSMWSIMASPLIAGNDLRTMSQQTKDILTNSEVIAINQDPAGIQGTRMIDNGDQEVWVKSLGSANSGEKAVGLLNRGDTAVNMSVNWDNIGLDTNVTVRDLWAHQDKGTIANSYQVNVPAHGIVLLKVKGTPIPPTPIFVTKYEAESSANTLGGAVRISSESTASSGKKVGWIGNGAANTLTFNNVIAPIAGDYTVNIRYYSGEVRSVKISVNGGAAETINFAAAGNWTTGQTKAVTLRLNAGENTIKFSNDTAYAPDIDYIEYVPPKLVNVTAPAKVTGVANGTERTASALGLPETVELVTDIGKGNANVLWNVDGTSYNPEIKAEQTFTVNGTVSLPPGVANPNNAALTTDINVTVNAVSSVPQSTLTGLKQVSSGQTFDVKLGLSNIWQSGYQTVYAQDATLHYDPAILKFESVASLKDGFQVIDQKETAPGQVRIVAAGVGANVPAQGDVLVLKFAAKSVVQSTNTTISVYHVVIANGQGHELQVGEASQVVQVSYVSVDKSLLNASIDSAQAKYDAAVEGDGDGFYAAGSKAKLKSVIDAARATANNGNALQQQVDSAKAALDAAVQAFDAKRISADINGQGGVTIGDLAIVAAAFGIDQVQAGWNEKADVNHDGKVDIVDLAIVAKAILQ